MRNGPLQDALHGEFNGCMQAASPTGMGQSKVKHVFSADQPKPCGKRENKA
jgi:hypothetical protein